MVISESIREENHEICKCNTKNYLVIPYNKGWFVGGCDKCRKVFYSETEKSNPYYVPPKPEPKKVWCFKKNMWRTEFWKWGFIPMYKYELFTPTEEDSYKRHVVYRVIWKIPKKT